MLVAKLPDLMANWESPTLVALIPHKAVLSVRCGQAIPRTLTASADSATTTTAGTQPGGATRGSGATLLTPTPDGTSATCHSAKMKVL